jgi:hypothetical protein
MDSTEREDKSLTPFTPSSASVRSRGRETSALVDSSPVRSTERLLHTAVQTP